VVADLEKVRKNRFGNDSRSNGCKVQTPVRSKGEKTLKNGQRALWWGPAESGFWMGRGSKSQDQLKGITQRRDSDSLSVIGQVKNGGIRHANVVCTDSVTLEEGS